MINSPTGAQKINVHGVGPQAEVMSLAQFRDAAGYSKQCPLPAREAKMAGVVKLAGATVAITTTGIVDGNGISGLAATDGLEGSAVASDGLPDGTTVVSVTKPATPGTPGSVQLSNVAPFAPTTGKPQPVVFSIPVRRSAISGLPNTDGLDGAYVSGGSLPEGTRVDSVTVPAKAATNTQLGSPGEVLLALPVVPPKPASPPPAGQTAPSSAPPAAPVPPPVNPEPVELAFKIPTQPVIIPDGVSRLVLLPAEPIDALTVTLPPNPVDGQLAFIFSTLAIAQLSVLPNTGQAVWMPPTAANSKQSPPTEKSDSAKTAPIPPKDGDPVHKMPFIALAAETGIGYLYSAPNATWDRIQ